MLTTLVALNLLCLFALAVALWRLTQPAPQADAVEGFARVLAAAAPVARSLTPRNEGSAAEDLAPARPEGFSETPGKPTGTPEQDDPRRMSQGIGAGEERLISGLALADRLAIIRRMLRGASVEDVAATVGVPEEAVRALYRQHGRGGATKC